jgi:hypothetical protein
MEKFEQLKKLKSLLDDGIISQEEYEQEKTKILEESEAAEQSNGTAPAAGAPAASTPGVNLMVNELMSAKAQNDYAKKLQEYEAQSGAADEVTQAKLFACAVEMQVLKTPSIATFQKVEEMTATSLGDGAYVISGYVDSQNSYGATLRTDFVLNVKLKDGTWKSLDRFVRKSGLGFAGILMGIGIAIDIVSTFFIGGDVDVFKGMCIAGSVIFGIGFLLSFFKIKSK